MISIGQHVINVSPWGAKFRTYSGAAISIADTTSDIVMINDYFNDDLDWYAWMMIICISLNILIQIILVIAQYRKLGKARIAKEVVVIVSFIKPGVDAARVVGGHPQEKGTLATPLIEMTACKISESVTEALASSILQVFVLLRTGRISYLSIFSICMSFASIAFSSTSIAFDLDCSPIKRAINPEFYVSKTS
jgi:hypothetical protein